MYPKDNRRAPPGSYGLPLFGVLFDTADFLFFSGWELFFKRRIKRYQSSVFKTSLFQKTIVVTDHEAISALFASLPFVQDYGFSWAVPPPPLVGNTIPSIFETGPMHDRPKSFYLKLFEHQSPRLPQVFEEIFGEYMERWARLGTFNWRDEVESFTIDFSFRWLLGIRVNVFEARTIYNNIFTNIFWRITRFFPWSLYSRSLRSYGSLVRSIESSEGFEELLKIAQEFDLLDRSYVAKQLAFVVGMNCYLGLQCLFKSIIGELSASPDACKRLLSQTQQRDPAQTWSSPEHAIDLFIMEILRLHPPVFFIFGRAAADTVIQSASGIFEVARGELLMGVIPVAHSNGSVFSQPSTFNPSRFEASEARSHLIWPRGLHDGIVAADDRTCPGKGAALTIARAFCSGLVTRAQWRIASPITWDTRWFNLNVAAPMGDLPVTSFSLMRH